MTIVNTLFYSTDSNKKTLHQRITPTDKHQESQQERWNDLGLYLIDYLYKKSKHKITSWLQGSYKLRTQIRPISKNDEFDIDLGIYFNWEGDSTNGNFSPRNLKSLVQDCLLQYKNEAEEDVIEVVIPPKERCSRIRFSENFHIDIPVYHLNEEKNLQALATENNGWENSDPKAFYEWFKSIFSNDEDNFQARRLIRYFKVWSKLHLNNPPSSILITVLVAEAFINLSNEQLSSDDLAFRNIANCIIKRIEKEKTVKNPVNTNEDLNRLPNDDFLLFKEGLDNLVIFANQALSATTEIETVFIWGNVFHQFFPAPTQDATDPKSRALTTIKIVPDVFITAISVENRGKTFKGYNEIGPIPKKCEITFALKNTQDLPLGSQLRWIVRNEGDEADFINDLGHFVDSGSKQTTEYSAYRGTHFMDLIIHSIHGEIWGFRSIQVTINGMPLKQRTPKKPWYTKFNKKR